MCYQVVERFRYCRCLYYEHAIDPCPAHGQRGHLVQEKTVLVGYCCEWHDGSLGYKLPEDQYATEDFVDDDSKSSDESDAVESIWSGAITVSRATSFIGSGDQDTLENILQVLLSDPLLKWEALLDNKREESDLENTKDVRFFLRAFESHLREIADSNIERHACFWLRSRIGYLADHICEHFNLQNSTAFCQARDEDESDQGVFERLQPIDIEEPDHTHMPTFVSIQAFIFGGIPYQALKKNVGSFTSNKLDYLKEITEIIIKNVHPPISGLNTPHANNMLERSLRKIISRFLHDLKGEAATGKLSASIRKGIGQLDRQDLQQLAARICDLWTRDIPSWHFYPVVLRPRSCPQLIPGESEDLEPVYEHEMFESFVYTSAALLGLSQSVFELPRKFSRLARFDKPVFGSRLTPSFETLMGSGQAVICFQCCCGQTIPDIYDKSTAEDVMILSAKVRQMRFLSLRQKFVHAASQNSKKGHTGQFIRRCLASFRASSSAKNDQLPQHQNSKDLSSNANRNKICKVETTSNQHIHNFIHWCMPWGRYATHMFPLQSCHISSDVEFFRTLRRSYDESRQTFRAFLSFKKPVALRFVKFRLFHGRLVDIHETNSIPPESQAHEYDYSPMPAVTIPPIGPNLLMHFFTHPEHALSHSVVLQSIPRRKKDCLEPCPVRGSSLGWGIDVITGTDEFKLFGLGLLGSLTSLIFGVAWAVAMKDIQGGFAVAGFMLSLFIFAIGSVKALDL